MAEHLVSYFKDVHMAVLPFLVVIFCWASYLFMIISSSASQVCCVEGTLLKYPPEEPIESAAFHMCLPVSVGPGVCTWSLSCGEVIICLCSITANNSGKTTFIYPAYDTSEHRLPVIVGIELEEVWGFFEITK